MPISRCSRGLIEFWRYETGHIILEYKAKVRKLRPCARLGDVHGFIGFLGKRPGFRSHHEPVAEIDFDYSFSFIYSRSGYASGRSPGSDPRGREGSATAGAASAAGHELQLKPHRILSAYSRGRPSKKDPGSWPAHRRAVNFRQRGSWAPRHLRRCADRRSPAEFPARVDCL